MEAGSRKNGKLSSRLPETRETGYDTYANLAYNCRAMRIFVGYLLVMTSSFLAAQTSQELHSRYGEPDGERFLPRPGIALTVE